MFSEVKYPDIVNVDGQSMSLKQVKATTKIDAIEDYNTRKYRVVKK